MQTFFCFLLMATIPLTIRLLKVPRWSPAYIFCLFWWVQFAISYVLYPNTPWSPVSSLYFVLCSLSVIIGFKINNKGIRFVSQPRMQETYNINYSSAKQLIKLFTVLGVAYAVLSIRRYGFSLRSFLDVNTLLQMNNQIAVARYGGTAESAGIFNQILLSFTYAAPMAGGCFYPYARTKSEKRLCFVTFVPEIIVLFSQNLKAGFIGCIIFWLSGFLTSMIRKQGSIKVPFKTFVKIGTVIVAVVIVLMTTMVLRIGTINSRTIGIVRRKFINYLFGHVGAIDDWINTNFLHSDLTLGGQTFIGISRYLGYSDRTQGIYLDNYNGPDLSTNVFTYFRGVYQDFGIVGSLIFFLIIGLIMGYTYRRLVNREIGRPFSEMLLVLTYAFSLYYIVSIFSYASFIVAFALFYLYSYSVYSGYTKVIFPKIKIVLRKR